MLTSSLWREQKGAKRVVEQSSRSDRPLQPLSMQNYDVLFARIGKLDGHIENSKQINAELQVKRASETHTLPRKDIMKFADQQIGP